MKFETTAKLLTGALRNLVPVVKRRNSIPVLGCVLFDGRTIRGTDLDLDMSISVPASVASGTAAIDHRGLLNLIQHVPPGETVRIDGGAEGATVTFSAGRYDLPTLPATDFPALTSGPLEPAEFDGEGFKKALAFTFPFISQDVTRYYLNGICLDGNVAVATDGHRLGCAPLGKGAFPRIIVPGKTVQMLRALPSPASIELSNDRPFARFSMAGATVSTKLIDGTFPDWRRVVPKEDGKTSGISLNRAEILAAAKRAVTVAGLHSSGTMAWDNGRIALVADGPGTGRAREFLALSSATGNGRISFNIRSLTSIASVFDSSETIEAAVIDGTSPIVFRGDSEAFAVLMPMRGESEGFATAVLSEWMPPRRVRSAA